MAVIYNKARTAKDLIEDRKNKQQEVYKNIKINKFAKKHVENKQLLNNKSVKTTIGITNELKYISNHQYTDDEIAEFNMLESIDNNLLSVKHGNIKSKLAYKYIMNSKNITSKYILPGQISLFTYNDPKFKDELEYYDKTPLVLFFGIFRTKNNDIREIGLNLHYFPPYTRKNVLNKVYETFKSYFNKSFNDPINKPNYMIDYQTLKHLLKKNSKLAFAVKEYVPARRGTTYIIPTKMLPIAFYTEGHFSNATLKQIYKFWRQF